MCYILDTYVKLSYVYVILKDHIGHIRHGQWVIIRWGDVFYGEGDNPIVSMSLRLVHKWLLVLIMIYVKKRSYLFTSTKIGHILGISLYRV